MYSSLVDFHCLDETARTVSLGNVIFVSVLGVYVIYLVSGGDQEASGTVPAYTITTYDNWPQYKYIGIFMMFSYFWTTTFITDMGTIGVASAACAWYFEDNGPVSLG